jgi:hypothetical protein
MRLSCFGVLSGLYIILLNETWQIDMFSASSKILATVNAPYGASLSAEQLAAKIIDPKSADEFNCSVFSFLSDVSPKLQHEFIEQMGLDTAQVSIVADKFSGMAGYKLALAA